jgi:hypothetical protein
MFLAKTVCYSSTLMQVQPSQLAAIIVRIAMKFYGRIEKVDNVHDVMKKIL